MGFSRKSESNKMDFDYDLFTIGAGSGGVRASRLTAQFGAKVAIAEESRVGGTCVVRGCVPKKFFVYASHFGDLIDDAKGYGWQTGEKSFHWQTLLQRKDNEIDRLNRLYIKNLEKAGVTIFHNRAVLTGPHSVRLLPEGREITARKILIATGGRPTKAQNVPGHELAITSDEAFHLEQLPEKMLIAGGGYIAVEFACIFAGLGVDVTLVHRGDQVLRGFDQDLRDFTMAALVHRGVSLKMTTTIEQISYKNGQRMALFSNGESESFGQIMSAIGRHPHTYGLGLEAAGVAVDDKQAIIVDKYYRTSQENIFALGDVTNRVNLTPVAIREGVAFAETQFNNNAQTLNYDVIAKAVFTQPALGSVGLTEEQARAAYKSIHIYRSEFRPMRNILGDNPEKMMMKLIVDGETNRVLGCHIGGEEAGEFIQLVAIALTAGLTKAQFDQTIAVHPTAAEELVTMREKLS